MIPQQSAYLALALLMPPQECRFESSSPYVITCGQSRLECYPSSPRLLDDPKWRRAYCKPYSGPPTKKRGRLADALLWVAEAAGTIALGIIIWMMGG